jgi:GNAT superfamily N-acetyltransferase
VALIPVADDVLATIVTTLEMPRKPPLRPMPTSRLRLVRWERPTLESYRALFARVGSRWLWFSRLAMDDAALAAILGDPGIAVHAVIDPAGIEVGMLELDLRRAGACEISYFGLIPELAGQGHGRWLMAETAWTRGVERVWLHTCTLDHPNALGFYRAQGFVATRRTIETFPDPRATGMLPADAAPQIPFLGERR